MRRVRKDREEGLEKLRDAIKVEPVKPRKEYSHAESWMKEEDIIKLVRGWLWEAGWLSVENPKDPPDLFAHNGKKCIGVESVSYSFSRHSFDISKAALDFNEGEMFFIIAVEVEPGRFEPMVLT